MNMPSEISELIVNACTHQASFHFTLVIAQSVNSVIDYKLGEVPQTN